MNDKKDKKKQLGKQLDKDLEIQDILTEQEYIKYTSAAGTTAEIEEHYLKYCNIDANTPVNDAKQKIDKNIEMLEQIKKKVYAEKGRHELGPVDKDFRLTPLPDLVECGLFYKEVSKREYDFLVGLFQITENTLIRNFEYQYNKKNKIVSMSEELKKFKKIIDSKIK